MCGAADRSLPENGSEVPFAGRKRVTVDARAASFATDETRFTEVRVVPGASISVTKDTSIGVEAPIVHRATMMPGDVELHASHEAWRGTIARLGIEGGLKLPTAPTLEGVPPDLQPGCASLVPWAGFSLTVGKGWWSGRTAVSLLMPIAVRDAPHPGDSVRVSLGGTFQPSTWFAMRLGAHLRWDGSADGDPRSGGAAIHVAPQIVLSPITDVVLTAGVAVPVLQAMRSYHETTPVALLGAGVDF
jgi:hypothetical protein